MKPYILLALSLCLVMSWTGLAVGDVTANFTDGNDDTTYVDAYHGIAGDGWSTPWFENQLLPGGDTLTATNTVTAANPVDGGGNYLSSTVTTSTTTKASHALLRQYKDGIDRTVPYTVDFTIRIDEDLTGFDAYHDRYTICDGATDVVGTGGDASWEILAHGGAGAHCYEAAAGYWTFYNGNHNGSYDGSDPTKLLNTGIALTAGGVYTFSVTVDPVLGTWDGSVSDGINTFSRDFMGWRTSRSGTTYSALVFGTKADAGDSTRQWSIDTISMTQLPATPSVLMDTMVARFDDGETDTAVDGYIGTSGQGWRSPWQQSVSNSSDVTSTATVLTSDPLVPGESSGNYLQVANTHVADTSYSGVFRNYKAYDEGIDCTKEHTIQFSIRIDEDLAAGSFTTVDDRYHISDVSGTSNTDSTASWMVTLCGGEGTYAATEDVGEWIFYDGNRDDGAMDVTRTVSSEMTVVQGTVYDFTIVVDPESQSYVGSVTDGTNTFTSGTLGWRRSSTEIGGNLMWDTRAGGILFGDERRFSLDNVVITQSLEQIPGDADGDGYVDQDDAAALAASWGTSTGATWAMGDFNNDGKIDVADAAILAAHWSPASTEATAVPEPNMLVLLVGGLVGLLMRSRSARKGGE